MAINLNDNIQVLVGKPTDSRYLDNTTPFATVGAATTALIESVRYSGLTVNVAGVEHWWKDGLGDGDLVPKESNIATVGITGATNGLCKTGQDAYLGGALIEATDIELTGATSLSITDSRTVTKGIQYADTYGDDFELNSLTDWRSVVTTNPISESADFQLSLDQLGDTVIVSGATEITVQIPLDATVDFPIGSIVTIQQGGAGAVTASGETGVSVTGIELSTTRQYSFVQYWKTAANTWTIVGGNIELWETSGSTILKPVDIAYKVPVQYISGLAGSISADNGLTNNAGTIVLGGALTGDTNLTGAHALSFTHSAINLTAPVCVTGAMDTNSTLGVGGALTLDTVAAGADTDPILVIDGGVVKSVTAASKQISGVNGICVDSCEVSLGGALTGDTTISGAHTLLLDTLTAFNATATNIGLTGAVCVTGALDTSSTLGVGSTLTLDSVGAGSVATDNILVRDSGGVVKSIAASSLDVTANNGLYVSDNNVSLGGDLTGNTLIGGAYAMQFHNQVINLTGDTAVNIGGSAINLKGTVASAVGNILTINETTGAIQQTTLDSLGGITGGTNGITDDGGQNLKLGAALTEATQICGAHLLTLGALNGICMTTANSCDIVIDSQSNGNLLLKSQSGTAGGNDFTNTVGIILNFDNTDSEMIVCDNSSSEHGLQYADDYHTTFVDRSLVDKYYVDTIATGLNVHATVAAATTAADGNLPLSGDTGEIDGLFITGITASLNRILVKNQTDATENGIYSGSTGVWGRTEDYNFAPAGEISNGDLIPVASGATLGNSQWINVSVNPVVSGTTDINFSLFSQQQGVVGGDGIAVATVGTNKEVSVDLAASQCGLEIASTKLKLDYAIFGSGLTNNAGVLSVNASTCGEPIGDEIPVLFNASCQLIVDSDDFSYTCASNGLTKDGCNVVLGGEMTGDSTICLIASTSLTFQDDRAAHSGLQYAAPYKDEFTIHSLVDVDFVTGLTTTSGIQTVSNGLNNVGTDAALGGTLTGTTEIDLNDTALNLTNTLNDFEVNFNSNSDVVSLTTDGGAYVSIDGASDAAGIADSTGANLTLLAGEFLLEDSTGNASVKSKTEDIQITGNIFANTTPEVGDTSDVVLVRNTSFGEIKTITVASITGNTPTAGLGITDTANTFDLNVTDIAATITEIDVKINTVGSDVLFIDSADVTTAVVSGLVGAGTEITTYDNGSGLISIDSANVTAAIGAGAAPDTNITVYDNTGAYAVSQGDIVTAIVGGAGVSGTAIVTHDDTNTVVVDSADIITAIGDGTGVVGTRLPLSEDSGALVADSADVVTAIVGGTGVVGTPIVTNDDTNKVVVDSADVVTALSTGTATGDVISIYDETGALVIQESDIQAAVTANTFTNGLCETAGAVCLGGTLTENTIIGGDTNTYCITFNSLSEFNAAATNIGLTGIITATGAVHASSTLGVSGATEIGGALTLSSVGAGDVATDSVVLIDTDGVVKKVAADTLGEDNNLYVVSGYTSATTLTDADYTVVGDSTGGAFTITLPAAPVVGQAYKIKDGGLDALTNNITIDGNTNLIDGVSTATINTDGGALELVWDGTQWSVLSFVN